VTKFDNWGVAGMRRRPASRQGAGRSTRPSQPAATALAFYGCQLHRLIWIEAGAIALSRPARVKLL